MIELCEWAGTAFGILGATLLALNNRASRFGWLAFLASNAFLASFAYGIGAMGLLTLQACFTATSLLGLARSGLLQSSKRARG